MPQDRFNPTALKTRFGDGASLVLLYGIGKKLDKVVQAMEKQNEVLEKLNNNQGRLTIHVLKYLADLDKPKPINYFRS